MPFVITPEEAQTIAQAVERHLTGRGMDVRIEAEVAADVQFRPTLVGEKDDLQLFVEAQGAPAYTDGLAEVVAWSLSERCYCEVHIATSMDNQLSGTLLNQLQRHGVGLMLVDAHGHVTEHSAARNPALTVSLTPGLKLGHCRAEVEETVMDFNNGTRKGALQHMCELVERETEKLLLVASEGGLIDKTVEQIDAMDWSDQINLLAARDGYSRGTCLVSAALKDDLHSFRNARNLFGHRVRTKKEQMKRERQYAERIIQGPRLVDDLLALQRKAKRRGRESN